VAAALSRAGGDSLCAAGSGGRSVRQPSQRRRAAAKMRDFAPDLWLNGLISSHTDRSLELRCICRGRAASAVAAQPGCGPLPVGKVGVSCPGLCGARHRGGALGTRVEEGHCGQKRATRRRSALLAPRPNDRRAQRSALLREASSSTAGRSGRAAGRRAVPAVAL
jgi:hypothetical protein